MSRLTGWRRGASACVGMAALLTAWPVGGQAPTLPPAASASLAKEVSAAMQAKKLETFAVRDTPDGQKFYAVNVVPNVQLLVVAANYEKPAEMNYWLGQKNFQSVYQDLRSSVYAKQRVMVEDAFADGLVGVPAKNQLAHDAFKDDTVQQVFNGVFVAPGKRDDKKMPFADYLKHYSAADAAYAQALTRLLEELKKS